MSKYGQTFLTKPILRTCDERWVSVSRMQFRETTDLVRGGEGVHWYELSLLGVINGCPILSKFFRLACTVEEETNEITKWGIRRWR